MRRLIELANALGRGIAHSNTALVGALLIVISTPFLAGAFVYDLVVGIGNTYLAGIIYLLLAPAFVLGLCLVLAGLLFFRGKEEVRLFTLGYLRDAISDPRRFPRLRRVLFGAVFIFGLALFVSAVLAHQGMRYLDSTEFCARFCHQVMEPAASSHASSPHSRIPCVNCHLGSGSSWLERSKLSGLRQFWAVATDSYSRPITTPLRHLRPTRATCQSCHRPEMFHGDKLEILRHFRADRNNTMETTAILLHVGSSGEGGDRPQGIHWHVAPENRLTYRATPDRRQIVEITWRRADGTQITFYNRSTSEAENLQSFTMDCIDCHNRPTHQFESAQQAIDRRMATGLIPRELPFVKKLGLELLEKDYKDRDNANVAIATGLRQFYANEANGGPYDAALVTRAIRGLQEAWSANIFPRMNVTWNSTIDHLGHGRDFDRGCARCHDGRHTTDDGTAISSDCDSCHLVLADREIAPQLVERLRNRKD